MRKKRICLVIPSLQAGGMERVMSELATYFSTVMKVEVHLVLYGIHREVYYTVPQEVIIHKPKFVFRQKRRFYDTIKTIFFVRSRVKALRPDSILSFGEYWNSFVLLALFNLKFPVFISDRCQPDKTLGKVQDRLRKWLYPKATGIIAQTNIAMNYYKGLFNHGNIKVIGNPIKDSFNGRPVEVNRENVVLTVGRLINTKHHDRLIEMFLRINMPGWKLVIVGDNALKQDNMRRLKELIDHHQANDRVMLAGKQLHVEDFYLKSRIFAFTSSSEGFPNVLGEAMMAGLPLVAFDCIAGPSDMIQDGVNGFLVPLFDEDTFEQRLKLLMSDEELRRRLGRQGFHDIQRFSLPRVGMEFYSFILQEREDPSN